MKKQNNFSFFSESIILALLTAATYVIGLAYEAGYASYYNIPFELVETPINTLVKAAGALLMYLACYFCIANLVWQFAPRSESLISRKIRNFLIFLLLIGLLSAPLLSTTKSWKEWIGLIIIIAMQIFYDFIFPLITQKKESNYISKITAQEELNSQARQHSLPRLINKNGGGAPIVLTLTIAMIALCAYSLGIKNAGAKNEYYQFENHQDELILKMYGNLYISAGFNKKTNFLTGNIIIRKLSDGETIKLIRIKTGIITSHKE